MFVPVVVLLMFRHDKNLVVYNWTIPDVTVVDWWSWYHLKERLFFLDGFRLFRVQMMAKMFRLFQNCVCVCMLITGSLNGWISTQPYFLFLFANWACASSNPKNGRIDWYWVRRGLRTELVFVETVHYTSPFCAVIQLLKCITHLTWRMPLVLYKHYQIWNFSRSGSLHIS